MRILVKYLSAPEIENKDYIARALTEKGLTSAARNLLELFSDEKLTSTELWAIGNALYVIDDKSTYPMIIQLAKSTKLGFSRQMLLGTLARSKSQEAYEVLIDCLNDETVKGHAIEALGRFGKTEGIEILEKTDVEKGKYEFKAKQTALKKLSRKKINTATKKV